MVVQRSPNAKRAAATARTLADISEPQRNGGGKHARAAARTVAQSDLPPQDVYDGINPAFPQSHSMKLHREIMLWGKKMTAKQLVVGGNISDSSEDDAGGMLAANGKKMSPEKRMTKYQEMIATQEDRKRMARNQNATADENVALEPPKLTRKRARSPDPATSNDRGGQVGTEQRKTKRFRSDTGS